VVKDFLEDILFCSTNHVQWMARCLSRNRKPPKMAIIHEVIKLRINLYTLCTLIVYSMSLIWKDILYTTNSKRFTFSFTLLYYTLSELGLPNKPTERSRVLSTRPFAVKARYPNLPTLRSLRLSQHASIEKVKRHIIFDYSTYSGSRR
jgi:hypothetical protein